MHRNRIKMICFTIGFTMTALLAGCSGKQDARTVELSEAKEGSIAEEKEEETEESAIEENEEIYVHVCGKVNQPGVYCLPAGSRLYEAIEAAGGLKEGAAAESLNQAQEAQDGQQIYVPSIEEASGGEASEAGVPAEASDGKLNLNTAAKEQLMTLTGIGEAKAAAIIRYREENGGFRSIEELMEVEGIKEGVFNKIKDQIKI